MSVARLVSPRARERQSAALVEQRQQVTQQSAAGWTIARGSMAPDYTRTGRTVRVQGWERHPVVQACARLVVDLVAAVPLEAYRRAADGEAQPVPATHPAQQLLDAPRPLLSAYALRSTLALHYLLYGNAFLHLERTGHRVAGLRPIHPEHMRAVYVDPERDLPLRYDWTTQAGTHRESPVEDIVHCRDLEASENGVFGYPRAAAALLDIQSDHEASQYVRQVIGNDGASALLFRSLSGIDQTEAKAARERWQERRAVRGQRGSAEWIGGIDEVIQIGFDLSQLEFPALRQVAREDICAVFGVDPRMVSIGSAAKDGGLSGVQFREARFRLVQQTVVPLMKAIESTLDLWLMPEFGDVFVRFSPDGLAELTEDETATSTRVREEVKAGIRTVEEARETVGLDADVDPKHHLLLPSTATLRTVARALEDADSETPDPVETAAAVAAAKAGAGGDAPKDDAPAARRALPPTVVTRAAALTATQLDAIWRAVDERAAAQEAPYERAARLRFADEAEGVRRLILASGERRAAVRAADDVPDDPTLDALAAEVARRYAAGGDYAEAWRLAFETLIRDTVRVGGDGLAGAVGVSFDLDNPRVTAAIRRRAAALVVNVTDTTRARIASLLEAGRASGMTVTQLAELVTETAFGEEITAHRAHTIARTEVMGALNEGEWLAATEDGVMQSKRWLSERGPNARANHEANDAAGWVAIGHVYPNGLTRPHAEGAPAKEVVRCRCAMLYSHDLPEDAA